MTHIRIGDLAKQAGCQVETVRYYEREGLLKDPVRSDANYRLYGAEQVERLRFIRHCRALDMTLEEIRALLKLRDAPEENCGQVNALLDEHLVHVSSRIAELQALEKQLKNLRGSCRRTQAAKDCGILQGLSTDADAPSTHLGTHGRSRH